MKTLLITIATLATLMASAALAGPAGDVRVLTPLKQGALQNAALGIEATDFVGARGTNKFMTGAQRINAYKVPKLFTFDGGKQTIIAKAFRSSDH